MPPYGAIGLRPTALKLIEPVGGTKLTAEVGTDGPIISDQLALNQLQTEFNVQLGEVDMLILDAPYISAQEAPVVIQVASAIGQENAKSRATQLFGVVGVCTPSPTFARLEHGTDSPFSDGLSLYPEGGAVTMFPEARFDVDLQAAIEAAKVEVVQQPKHGVVVFKDGTGFKYVPNPDYVGNDKIEFLVNIDGKNIKLIYFIKVVDDAKLLDTHHLSERYRKYCPKDQWRISSSLGDSSALASMLTQSWLTHTQSKVTVTFADLSGQSVGETTGNVSNAMITLARRSMKWTPPNPAASRCAKVEMVKLDH